MGGGRGVYKIWNEWQCKSVDKNILSKMTFKYQILTVLTSASFVCKNKSWPLTQSVSRTRPPLNLRRRMSIHPDIFNLHPQKISLIPVSWTGTKGVNKQVESKYAAEIINVSYCLTKFSKHEAEFIRMIDIQLLQQELFCHMM